MFQGGPSCSIFSPQGTDPLHKQNIGVKGRVKRTFDPQLKGYALVCDGGPLTKAEFPNPSTRKGLNLTQKFLLVQMELPSSFDPLCIELTLCDSQATRRRLVLSSGFRSFNVSPLHAQIPLITNSNLEEQVEGIMPKGAWFTLCFDLQEVMSSLFPGAVFRSIESLSFAGHCKIRQLFTLKVPPSGDHSYAKYKHCQPIPRQLQFPVSLIGASLVFFSVDMIKAALEQQIHLNTSPEKPIKKMKMKTMLPYSARSSEHDSARKSLPVLEKSKTSAVLSGSPEPTPRKTEFPETNFENEDLEENFENDFEKQDLEENFAKLKTSFQESATYLQKNKSPSVVGSDSFETQSDENISWAGSENEKFDEMLESDQEQVELDSEQGDELKAEDGFSVGDELKDDDCFSVGDDINDCSVFNDTAELQDALEKEKADLFEMEKEFESDSEPDEALTIDKYAINFVKSSISKALVQEDGCSEKNEEENATITESEKDLDLLFDPILNCYYCPKTNKYYQMKG